VRAARPPTGNRRRQIRPVKIDGLELQPWVRATTSIPQETLIGFVQTAGNSDLNDRRDVHQCTQDQKRPTHRYEDPVPLDWTRVQVSPPRGIRLTGSVGVS